MIPNQNAPAAAVRYFQVPADIQVDPGMGFTEKKRDENGNPVDVDGGSMSFFFFFAKLMMGKLARQNREDAEEFLCARLKGVKAGAKVEIPEEYFAALVASLPVELADQAPELYFVVRPFVRAVRTAPSVKPSGWDTEES